MNAKFRQCIGFVLAGALIATALFGLYAGMNEQPSGIMSGCIFDQSKPCSMSYVEHIQHWQKLFTATHQLGDTIAAFAVFVFAGGGLLAVFFYRKNRDQKQSTIKAIGRQRAIIAKLSNRILQALSDGILSPQIYNQIAIS